MHCEKSVPILIWQVSFYVWWIYLPCSERISWETPVQFDSNLFYFVWVISLSNKFGWFMACRKLLLGCLNMHQNGLCGLSSEGFCSLYDGVVSMFPLCHLIAAITRLTPTPSEQNAKAWLLDCFTGIVHPGVIKYPGATAGWVEQPLSMRLVGWFEACFDVFVVVLCPSDI